MTKAVPAKAAARLGGARRRTRRSAEEITRRLLDAAVEEFAANGYAGARTANIAQRAGVVEPLLFKYFGSKTNLFQRAIFDTLDRNYAKFVLSHERVADDPAAWENQAREYVGQQQHFLRDNSRMFMSLIIQESFYGDETQGADGLNGLQAFLDKMSAFAEARAGDRSDADPKLVARISFASLLACALFSDWLFPKGMASDDKIRAAVIDFILKGADLMPRGPAESA